MKTTLLFSASLLVAAGAFGQGQIQFGNLIGNGAVTKAPIYDVDPASPTVSKTGNTSAGAPVGTQTYGGPLLAGTSYTCTLWGLVGANKTEAALELISSTTFRTGTAAGFINTLTVSVPGAPLSGTAGNPNSDPFLGTFQVRAWNNLGGTVATWAAALANPAAGRGKSALINTTALGGTGDPPATPPALLGLQSFSLAIVPEPSSIALGVLGLGTLMFLRRRR